MKTGYEGLRADPANMVKAGTSNVRGDSLDYWIFQFLYSNNGLIESPSTCWRTTNALRRSALSQVAASSTAGGAVNLDYAGCFSVLCNDTRWS